MRYLASAVLALMTLFSTMTISASDAEARRWHRHHGGGIALGVGAAILGGIALSRHRYYDDDYYYGDYSYGRSYYRPYYGRSYGWGGGYGHRYYRDRRGLGGPAWGRRGHGWAGGRHRY